MLQAVKENLPFCVIPSFKSQEQHKELVST